MKQLCGWGVEVKGRSSGKVERHGLRACPGSPAKAAGCLDAFAAWSAYGSLAPSLAVKHLSPLSLLQLKVLSPLLSLLCHCLGCFFVLVSQSTLLKVDRKRLLPGSLPLGLTGICLSVAYQEGWQVCFYSQGIGVCPNHSQKSMWLFV